MNQISVRQLEGSKVSVQGQNSRVKRVALDLVTGQVLGLITESEQIIYKNDLTDIGDGSVIANEINPIELGSLADRANRSKLHLLGLIAVTQSGEEFGTVADAILELPTLQLQKIVVNDDGGERLIDKSQIYKITDTEVVFLDAVVKGHLNWQTKIETDNLAI